MLLPLALQQETDSPTDSVTEAPLSKYRIAGKQDFGLGWVLRYPLHICPNGTRLFSVPAAKREASIQLTAEQT